MNEETQTTRREAVTDSTAAVPEDPIPLSENSPEAEQLRFENETLKHTLRMRDARESVTKALTAAGARTPDLLFDSVQDRLQFADDGRLINAVAVTEYLAGKFPEQFGAGRRFETIDGGAGTGGVSSYITRDTLSKMSPAEIKHLDWDDVRRALADR